MINADSLELAEKTFRAQVRIKQNGGQFEHLL